jgi:hypothetical protein
MKAFAAKIVRVWQGSITSETQLRYHRPHPFHDALGRRPIVVQGQIKQSSFCAHEFADLAPGIGAGPKQIVDREAVVVEGQSQTIAAENYYRAPDDLQQHNNNHAPEH